MFSIRINSILDSYILLYIKIILSRICILHIANSFKVLMHQCSVIFLKFMHLLGVITLTISDEALFFLSFRLKFVSFALRELYSLRIEKNETRVRDRTSPIVLSSTFTRNSTLSSSLFWYPSAPCSSKLEKIL